MTRILLVLTEAGELHLYQDAGRNVAVELRNQSVYTQPVGGLVVGNALVTPIGRVGREPWAALRFQPLDTPDTKGG